MVQSVQDAFPMPYCGGRDVSLCVQVMAVPAERKKVRCIVASAILYPKHVMKLQCEDISTGWIGTLISGLAKDLVANKRGNSLAIGLHARP